MAQPLAVIADLASASQEILLSAVEAGDAFWALANRVRVQQEILDLMPDAVTAMARRAMRRLRLVVRPYGNEWVEIRVSDTGPGVPPAVAQRMFLPFVTTDPAGHGPGLFVCRDIVDIHGVLWLHNHSPHVATFVVALPRMREGPYD